MRDLWNVCHLANGVVWERLLKPVAVVLLSVAMSLKVNRVVVRASGKAVRTTFFHSFRTVSCVSRFTIGVYLVLRVLLDLCFLLMIHGGKKVMRRIQIVRTILVGSAFEKRRYHLKRRIRCVSSYEEFRSISSMIDAVTFVPPTGRQAGSTTVSDWREIPVTHLYDWKGLRHLVQALNATRDALQSAEEAGVGVVQTELFYLLRKACHRNFCQVANPKLHAYSRVGTKRQVEEFQETMADLIGRVADYLERRLDAVEILFKQVNSSDLIVPQDSLTYLENVESLRAALASVEKEVTEVSEMLSSLKVAQGRTALCLSGGGTLAFCHLGVLKALAEIDSIPKVISGSSGGSYIAGLLALMNDEEFERSCLGEQFVPMATMDHLLPPFSDQVQSFLQRGFCMEAGQFSDAIRQVFGDITFAEAFSMTGRYVSITVSPANTQRPGSMQEALLCNCITTPDVLIWSAVVASCSLPGLIPPNKLFAKKNVFGHLDHSDVLGFEIAPGRLNKDAQGILRGPRGLPMPQDSENSIPSLSRTGSNGGRVLPVKARVVVYSNPDERWMDGSVLADIPSGQLGTLFNVKEFVVTQVNPHLVPFVQKLHQESYEEQFVLTRIVNIVGQYLVSDMKHRYFTFLAMMFQLRIAGQDVSQFLFQESDGTINIIPSRKRMLPFLMAPPTPSFIHEATQLGYRRSWPHLQRIKRNMVIEKALHASCERVTRLSKRLYQMRLHM
ncbi:MAG: uncharacterized protein KVP18_000341 [Porospora cf. gigantea A]|uniref:uncharacterized protein n=2 Tax=Porospora cf. gigantea A TaxID=2853593 RepID=UPI00355AB89D|nr:MAG: hypothetical protein KVP18_000341 [Porospora cf. gigantea A]